MDPDFDPVFYRNYYHDLAPLSNDQDLFSHYMMFGRKERRHPSALMLYEEIQKDFGELPSGFDPGEYRDIHPDLRGELKFEWEAVEHYLRYGKNEQRSYYRFEPEIYRQLYFSDKVITDYELSLDYRDKGRGEGRIGTWAEFIRRQDVGSGVWIERLKTDEFHLLNQSWAGPIATKLQAVEIFLSEGIDKIVPIAFDMDFDADYYREAHPELGKFNDPSAYRHWIFEGLERDWIGSPGQHFSRKKLSLREYPPAFDWRSYARGQGLKNPNRWSTLDHLLSSGFRTIADVPVFGPAGEFLFALGECFRGQDDKTAVEAFEAALRAGEDRPAVHHHLADSYFRLGLWREALSRFQRAAVFPEAEVWTFVNGARSAIKLGAFRAAYDLLSAGKGRVSGDPVWRSAVGELIESYFQARTRRARRLYRSDRGRARADAAIGRVVARVIELWDELDPIGAPLPVSPNGRVVILANLDIRVCTHYRVEQKAQLFSLIGRDCEIFSLESVEGFISALPGASAAIFFRVPAGPSVVRSMRAACRLGVPTYYEIDDLIFDSAEYPDSLQSYGGLLSREDYESILFWVPMFRAAAQMCDYGIVSTTPLRRAVEPLVKTGRVFVLPNGLDDRNESYLTQPPPRVRRDDSIIIAYASGTKAHNTDFNELAGPALVQILRRHPNVKLLLVGYLALSEEFDDVRSQIVRFEYVDNSQTFWSLLADADINLAVLIPTWATDAKSEIKWLEAAAMGIPSIVSETAMYKEVLEDGVDALIVRTPKEWLVALERIVADPELRRSIGERARDKAARNYSLEANAKRLHELLSPALDVRKPFVRTQGAKPRVLLANVWFPPQTIGGATRVVRNNLDHWLDAGLGDSIDFAVVTTDHEVQPPYRRRVEEYRGVPVLRISTPLEPNMDWRAEDEGVGEIFTDFLDLWRPDLVHFHAIQRLTASIVQASQAAGVRYLATVHDAWWVSDFPFLVDDQGRLQQPCENLPKSLPAAVDVAQSLDRRRILRSALDGAEAVLAVSHSFADIYRACGFQKTVAVPNGLPVMPNAAREPSASGRVRLAHVGNISKHKGFHLIEAALKQSSFRNLELVAIDYALPAGSEQRAVWGGTPVTIIGNLPQEHIHELYGATDVLLAPSIWPESYGLVTREALAAGCWVVAGNLGAIGEDVEPGVNGFVIDVSDATGLVDALARIDADPAPYLKSPAKKPILRTAAEQADEVAALYRGLLDLPRVEARVPALVSSLRGAPLRKRRLR